MFDLTLLDPGRAEDFFTLTRGVTFQAEADGFNIANALWLAELSRLAYRRSGDEQHRHPGRSRNDFLTTVGLRESDFFDSSGTEAILVDGSEFRVLAFRGTEPQRLQEDFLTDFQASLKRHESFPGRVHQGFADALLKIWPKIEPKLRDSAIPLFITGHSLGGALATLAAALCTTTKIPYRAAYTFGAPRIGDSAFREAIDQACPVFRTVNDRDLVPRVPPFLSGYVHTGGLVQILHNGHLDASLSHDDSPELILLPLHELLDHVPLHYVQKLQKMV